jgi:hypothetical protein
MEDFFKIEIKNKIKHSTFDSWNYGIHAYSKKECNICDLYYTDGYFNREGYIGDSSSILRFQECI